MSDVERQAASTAADSGATASTGNGEPAPAGDAAGAAPHTASAGGQGDAVDPAAAPRERHPRLWPGVAIRAAVVIVVAAVGYQAVVPMTLVDRTRLARLIPTANGTTTFPGAPARALERPASTGNVKALMAAAATAPTKTGLYIASWPLKGSPMSAVVDVAFLLPDAAAASQVHSNLVTTQLSAGAYASGQLTRTGQFATPGVSGSDGSVYSTDSRAPAQARVAAAVWQQGRVVGLVETITSTSPPQADAEKATQTLSSHLRTVLPGFSLTYTRRPPLATGLWIAGSLVLLVLLALGPVAWRVRQGRKTRRLQEELDNTLRVGGQTIVRRRQV